MTTGGQPMQAAPVRALVLLAGTIRATSLPAQLGRSILDLPLDASHRLLDAWRLRLDDLFDEQPDVGLDQGIVVLQGETIPPPAPMKAWRGLGCEVVRDESSFRGTAGALRDLCTRFAPDDYILLGTASQCPERGFLASLMASARGHAGITIGADTERAPSGLLLIRCDALQSVPLIGFHDLKEQVLPRLAATEGVQVALQQGPVSSPIRDLRSYVAALRSWHEDGTLVGATAESALAERWSSAFAIVEEGADVHPSARLHDAVVLAGARIGARSEVIRSVVGPGAMVAPRARILDRLVPGPEAANTLGLTQRHARGEP